VTSLRENPHPNKIIFLIETRRLGESVDGLNSSGAIVAGELWLLKRLKSAPKFWRTRDLKGCYDLITVLFFFIFPDE